jgi:hypothetical protein
MILRGLSKRMLITSTVLFLRKLLAKISPIKLRLKSMVLMPRENRSSMERSSSKLKLLS